MEQIIYLDYNATTPVDQRVLDAMLPYFITHFGNAASKTHPYGWFAEKGVKEAREFIAEFIDSTEQEIIFTSGATEAINLAIKGVATAYIRKGKHIITAATEHKAVLDACKALERTGYEITYLPVDSKGLIDPLQLSSLIREDTILVSVMLANNETGVIQPIREIADIAHEHGAIMMSDAVQAVGKVPVSVKELGIDLMPFSAHKFYGPKGVGGLYVSRRNPRVRLLPQIDGGGHERGMRSGTLNVPGIVGMGKALSVAKEIMKEETERLAALKDRFEQNLLKLGGVSVNGDLHQRLSHVSNIAFEGVESQELIMKIRGIAASTGSACTSAVMEPSHVLKAMGLSQEEAYSSLRFSLGRYTTEEQIDQAIEQIGSAVKSLRNEASIIS